ncbi:hypothetical protein [Chloroflexus aurantiacus]
MRDGHWLLRVETATIDLAVVSDHASRYDTRVIRHACTSPCTVLRIKLAGGSIFSRLAPAVQAGLAGTKALRIVSRAGSLSGSSARYTTSLMLRMSSIRRAGLGAPAIWGGCHGRQHAA